jgi:hypothetical protein
LTTPPAPSKLLRSYVACNKKTTSPLISSLIITRLSRASSLTTSQRCTGMGIPEGRQELLVAVRRAEVLLRGGQPLTQQNRSHATGPRGPTTPASVPPVSSSQAPRAPGLTHPPGPALRPAATTSTQRVSCYRCGGPGHYANACPEAKCNKCGKIGHSDSRCPEPTSGTNATLVARHVAPDP